jgi:hypothetical protein
VGFLLDCLSLRAFISSSVKVFGGYCFSDCKNLRTVTFEPGSQLWRVGESAFAGSGLTAILVPASVEVLCESCFSNCQSLRTVTFESGSLLRRLGVYCVNLAFLVVIV